MKSKKTAVLFPVAIKNYWRLRKTPTKIQRVLKRLSIQRILRICIENWKTSADLSKREKIAFKLSSNSLLELSRQSFEKNQPLWWKKIRTCWQLPQLTIETLRALRTKAQTWTMMLTLLLSTPDRILERLEMALLKAIGMKRRPKNNLFKKRCWSLHRNSKTSTENSQTSKTPLWLANQLGVLGPNLCQDQSLETLAQSKIGKFRKRTTL